MAKSKLRDGTVDIWPPVKGGALDRERYRIMSENTDPEDEKCEFEPGDVVHCSEKELTNGTKNISRLVAVAKG